MATGNTVPVSSVGKPIRRSIESENRMGEAKRRKATDPNYGRVPKDPGHRGLVVSAPIEIDGTKLFAKSSNLDPQELRFSLLFWERLVWPTSRVIYFGSNQDEQFLEAAGVLERPDYTFDGDGASGIARGQVQALLDLDQKEPGKWSLSQGERSFVWTGEAVENDGGTLVELHRAIPIPKHDVPLAEVLEFRERRRDELLHLRGHLEGFAIDVEQSGGSQAALERRLVEIDQACANALTVGREWRFPVYLSNIKVSFSLNLVRVIAPALAAFKWAENMGLPLPAAAAAAGVVGAASTLDVKGDYGLRAVKRPVSPFKYAYSLDREL
jgi:hypothetical protein